MASVRSVVETRRNGDLLAEVARLWIGETDTVLDVTYGRGNFWTKYRPLNLATHDLALDGVDFRSLPEADLSVDVVVYDPPYIPGSRNTGEKAFAARYGLTYQTTATLRELIDSGLKECARVVAPGGRLLVKCCDYVNSGRYHTGRHFVVTKALECGLRQVDEFVHYSGLGPEPQVRGVVRNGQVTSRRAHSFLCVFKKPRR